MNEKTGFTRRELFPAAAAFAFIPRRALGANDKLNIAAVGVGGMGQNYVEGCKSENIVAIADVDDAFAAPVRKKYPEAKAYRDFRVMLEKEKGIDAQSCSTDPAVTTEEWVKAGVVGPVREVHVWTDRPVWPQALARPSRRFKPPRTLDWDIWLGPAAVRPFHPVYHPFNFRGWYDFGTGALGDMACHTFHIIVKALELGAPASVNASATVTRVPLGKGEKPEPVWAFSRKGVYPETFPHSSVVTWDFPARGSLPAARMHWYDGGLRPPRPAGMDPDKDLGEEGVLFVGEKGTLWSGFSGGPKFLSAAQQKAITPPPKTLPRTAGHYLEWIEAAKGGKPATCNFSFGSRLTEIALLGVIAQRTGKYLEWDADQGRFTNNPDANELLNPPYRAGWKL
ncbi:MAG: hypothetical protein LAQ30_29065 [Acidobacteriia bacterium]|nr:hypothetical protein [Terriglobia bacterium]